uniref:Orf1 protein n=1 Tax=Kudoa iwatai TaxID=269814 RepID=A0A0H5BIG7_9CNID|nr:orf1 protein [Kudoa iwatai]
MFSLRWFFCWWSSLSCYVFLFLFFLFLFRLGEHSLWISFIFPFFVSFLLSCVLFPWFSISFLVFPFIQSFRPKLPFIEGMLESHIGFVFMLKSFLFLFIQSVVILFTFLMRTRCFLF